MRIAGSIINVISGIAVAVAVFLPWVSPSLFGYTIYSASGLTLTHFAKGEFIVSFTEPYLVLAGAIMMSFCALPALVISSTTSKEQSMLRILNIVFTIGAFSSTVGAIWFIVQESTAGSLEAIDYGFYLCLAFSFLALASGILTTLLSYRDLRRRESEGEAKVEAEDQIARPLIVLFCGASITILVFLQWVNTNMADMPINLSGWELAADFGSEPLIEPSFLEIYFVLGGGVLMGLCFMLASTISRASDKKIIPFVLKSFALMSAVMVLLSISWFFINRGLNIEGISFQPWLYMAFIVALLGVVFVISAVTTAHRIPIPDIFKRPLRPARMAFIVLISVLAMVSVVYGNQPFSLTPPILNYIPPGMEDMGHNMYGWVLCSSKYGEYCSGSVGSMTENRGKPYIYLSILYQPAPEWSYDMDEHEIAQTMLEDIREGVSNESKTGIMYIGGHPAAYHKFFNNDSSSGFLIADFIHSDTSYILLSMWDLPSDGEEKIMAILGNISF